MNSELLFDSSEVVGGLTMTGERVKEEDVKKGSKSELQKLNLFELI